MSARVVLVNAPVHKITSDHGMGYQMPLWAVAIGGPLIDAGYKVDLIDADAKKLTPAQISSVLVELGARVVMLGHPASTPAYKAVAALSTHIKRHLPHVTIVYGGVFPTFAYQAVMEECPAIDVIVRGEGEAIVVELLDALRGRQTVSQVAVGPASVCGGQGAQGPSSGPGLRLVPSLGRVRESSDALSAVDGIVWRHGTEIVVNADRELIRDLDAYRFAWELVDWDLYSMFGMGRSAAIQFSRGCTYHCDYCGQWQFWQKYRHRSVERFVDELELLRERYGVTHIAPSDEHFFGDRETSEEMLRAIIARGLDISLYVNTTVRDVLRDRDLIELYPKAGITFVTMGVESDDPEVQRRIHKNNALSQSIEAIGLLRRNRMVTLIHMIYGLEDESWRTVARKIRAMFRMNADFVNHEYIMPHFWTPLGRLADPERIIQSDMAKWDYRNQVVDVPDMSPGRLFWAVKLSELIVHSRPRGIARFLFGRGSKAVRGFRLRGGLRALRTWFVEVAEYYLDHTMAPAGEIARAPVHESLLKLALGVTLAAGASGSAHGTGLDRPAAAEVPVERCPLRRLARKVVAGPESRRAA